MLLRKWESRISEITSESDRLAWRASRRAVTSVSLLSVKLTRLGLRKDLGLPIGIIAHFMRKNGQRSSVCGIKEACTIDPSRWPLAASEKPVDAFILSEAKNPGSYSLS